MARTISTKVSEGKQIPVYSKQEALSYYKDSKYLDGIDLIMIDLDLSNFKGNNNIKALDLPKQRLWQRRKRYLIYQKNLNLQL